MKLRFLLIAFLMMLIPLQNEAQGLFRVRPKVPRSKPIRPITPKPITPRHKYKRINPSCPKYDYSHRSWRPGVGVAVKQIDDERRKRSKVQTPFGKGRSKGVSPTPSASANIKALTRSSKMKKEFLHKQQVYHKNARLNQKLFKADSVIERLHSDSLKLQ